MKKEDFVKNLKGQDKANGEKEGVDIDRYGFKLNCEFLKQYFVDQFWKASTSESSLMKSSLGTIMWPKFPGSTGRFWARISRYALFHYFDFINSNL